MSSFRVFFRFSFLFDPRHAKDGSLPWAEAALPEGSNGMDMKDVSHLVDRNGNVVPRMGDLLKVCRHFCFFWGFERNNSQSIIWDISVWNQGGYWTHSISNMYGVL